MNKLILGTVQMGIPYGINNNRGQINISESLAILNEAYNSGIRTLDTAEAYGDAHQVIGEFHKSHPEKRFNIITKLPHTINHEIIHKVENYLKELEVEKLNTLLFHSHKTFKENCTNLKQLIDLKRAGVITNIGVSVYTNDEIEDVLNYEEIDIIQLPFNTFDNVNKRGEIIEKIKQNKKIIHSRSCFLQGLVFQALDSDKKIVLALKEELQNIDFISKTYNIDIHQLCLNYCLQQCNIDSVLIGVDNLNQLQKNLVNSTKKISQEVISEINKIKITNLNLLNPSLWDNL